MTDIFNTNMLTIREAYERAKAEGYGMPVYSIKCAAKKGEIHVYMAGRKALICYPNMIETFTGRPYQKPELKS